MTDIVRHRGPDDEGYALFDFHGSAPLLAGGKDTPVAAGRFRAPHSPQRTIDSVETDGFTLLLGHRRLSILDLSPAGHQPICDPAGLVWLVYNGEIYNFVEIRGELERLGHTFLSTSDTEVLLAAYMEWGLQCLSRLRGMFSFLLYDRRTEELHAVRDRFGIKPLYYHATRGGIGFASEIKQFHVMPGWQARLNHQRAYEFLAWGVTDHSDETLFKGVFQVPPGCQVTLPLRGDRVAQTVDADGRLASFRWYSPDSTRWSGNFLTASDRLRATLAESVDLHLRSDVEVGSCLSGGLDSSAVVCLSRKALDARGSTARQHSFTAISSDPRINEAKWARIVSAWARTSPSETQPDPAELFRLLPELAWQHDEPFGSTSIFAQWTVFRLAAESGVKVVLDGQGADELFAGYHGFFGPRLAGLLRDLHLRGAWNEAHAISTRHGLSRTRLLAGALAALMPRLASLATGLGRAGEMAPAWISPHVLLHNPSRPGRTGAIDSVGAFSRQLVDHTTLPMLLKWEDRNSMSHSIESRVPFMDHRLVELAYSFPDDFKLDGGVTKRVLRESLRGLIPDAIEQRVDKIGFATAEENWMLHEHAAEVRMLFKNAIDQASGIVKREDAMRMLHSIQSGERPFDFAPWRIISFGAWMNRFGVSI